MRFDPHPLTGKRHTDLAKWFGDHQASVFLMVLESEADFLEAAAIAETMADPVAVIAGDEPTQSVQDMLKEAAAIRLVAKKFVEIGRKPEFILQKPYVNRPASSDSAS